MRRGGLASLALLAAGLVGCGGGSHTSATTSSPTSGEAAKSGAQIIADSEAALGRVTSVHVSSTGVQSGQPTTISGVVQIPGRLHITLSQGAGSVQFVVVDRVAYFYANAAYFTQQGLSAATAQRVANRWVIPPDPAAFGFGSLVVLAEPATIGRCTIGPHVGTVTVKGTAAINGQSVIVLVDHGDVPGSTPRLLYVAASGPPLPVRIQQTGPQRRGGTPDPICQETKDDVSGETAGEVDNFSGYGAGPAITAPPGAVTLGALPGGSSV